MEIVRNMLSAGRIIRLLILVLACVAVWKVYEYVGHNRGSTPAPGLPQPVLDSKTKSDLQSSVKLGIPQGLNELYALSVLVVLALVLYVVLTIKQFGGTTSLSLPTEVATTAPLHVQVFYEPLCPDSRHFIRHQLTSAMDQLGEHIDLQMVPYGKATTTEENGVLSFQCQHGPTECLANKIHSCVVREIKDQTQQLKIIDCMIADNYKPKSIAQKCVAQVLGTGHWAPIQLCYSSRDGDLALKHMGSLTNSLDPSVSFIPTITIDQSQDDQKYMLQDFTKVLCKRFKGTPPPACSS